MQINHQITKIKKMSMYMAAAGIVWAGALGAGVAYGLVDCQGFDCDLVPDGVVNVMDAAVVWQALMGGGGPTATKTPGTTTGPTLPGPTLPPPPPPTSMTTCLESGSGLISVLTGSYSTGYKPTIAANTRVDARGATFLASLTNLYPVNVIVGSGVCWVGGQVNGNFDTNGTWDDYKNPNRAGFTWSGPGLVVDGLRIHNNQDGIRITSNSEGWTIKNTYMTEIHDDCVEDDWLYGGVISDSLLDGCYMAFSNQGNTAPAGSGERIFRIEKSYVRLQPFNGPFRGGTPDPGHATFFKWRDKTANAQVAIHDSIFRQDQESSGSQEGIHENVGIKSCSNNTLVWLGGGTYPGNLGKDPTTGLPCFTVTTDVSVWNNARQDWLNRHGY